MRKKAPRKPSAQAKFTPRISVMCPAVGDEVISENHHHSTYCNSNG
jgi:hypothetical protein